MPHSSLSLNELLCPPALGGTADASGSGCRWGRGHGNGNGEARLLPGLVLISKRLVYGDDNDSNPSGFAFVAVLGLR